ncbi:MAG: helix-turn-helix transcriptional regulator, partial [Lachnospiraceae bacterium]|nr:helix-turn-helix transcriptional regulator [Lachnospiraceae bacterium]
MSDFSDKCKFYLLESGSNVYQIAQSANLDRTTVQRMLTGKRLPSQEFVKTFCNHLRINNSEKEDLLECYTMEKIGKATYQNRKYVQSLLKH